MKQTFVLVEKIAAAVVEEQIFVVGEQTVVAAAGE